MRSIFPGVSVLRQRPRSRIVKNSHYDIDEAVEIKTFNDKGDIFMKIYMKPIESIVWFTREGIPHPLRYRITSEDKTYTTVKIRRILTRTEEKIAGNRMLIFRCEGEINGVLKIFELKYELNTCRWFLYKM